MALKVDLGAQDVIRQAETIRLFPEISDPIYTAAMQQMAQAVYDAIDPRIPRMTGMLAGAFSLKVTGHGLNVKGNVGWLEKGYERNVVHLVDQDVRPHAMNVYAFRLGKYITMHPGHHGLHFMEGGLAQATSQVEALAATANDAVVERLAVK